MFIHPFMYMMRNNKRPGGIFYLWANEDEKGGGDPEKAFIDNWYGVYEIFNHDYKKFEKISGIRKYFLSYEWLALRNSAMILKKKLFPFKGPYTVVKTIKFEGPKGKLTWRNGTIPGVSHIIIKDSNGKKSFRWSKSWPTKSGELRYFQMGAGATRYHLKRRKGRLSEVH